MRSLCLLAIRWQHVTLTRIVPLALDQKRVTRRVGVHLGDHLLVSLDDHILLMILSLQLSHLNLRLSESFLGELEMILQVSYLGL